MTLENEQFKEWEFRIVPDRKDRLFIVFTPKKTEKHENLSRYDFSQKPIKFFAFHVALRGKNTFLYYKAVSGGRHITINKFPKDKIQAFILSCLTDISEWKDIFDDAQNDEHWEYHPVVDRVMTEIRKMYVGQPEVTEKLRRMYASLQNVGWEKEDVVRVWDELVSDQLLKT